MTDLLSQYHIAGLVIGLSTFLIIGIFHPLVIKAEYYFGVGSWRWFLVAGILFVAAALFVDDLIGSCLLGVAGFSSFWSIGEIIQQQERVRKGWFPRNPKRRYPWDSETENITSEKKPQAIVETTRSKRRKAAMRRSPARERA